jgi:hypothetical protein
MTTAIMPPTATGAPTVAEQVAILRAMLQDRNHEAHWPEIEQAIVYLTATSVLAA